MPRVTEIINGGGDSILDAEFASEREIFGDVLNPSRTECHFQRDQHFFYHHHYVFCQYNWQQLTSLSQ